MLTNQSIYTSGNLNLQSCQSLVFQLLTILWSWCKADRFYTTAVCLELCKAAPSYKNQNRIWIQITLDER